jgi:hypothetical protein
MLLFRSRIKEHIRTINLDQPPRYSLFSISTSLSLDYKYKIFQEYRLYKLMCHFLIIKCIGIHDIISINQNNFNIEAYIHYINLLALLEKDAYKLYINPLMYNLHNNQLKEYRICIKFLRYYPNYHKY